MKKERHGFLSFWLIGGLVVSIICVFIYAIAIDDYTMLYAMEITSDVAVIFVILSLATCICNILLLNWKLSGFIVYCIVSVISFIVYPTTYMVVLGIVSPLLEFALFQLKKNGISAWAHLTNDYEEVNSSVSANDIYEKKEQNEFKKCPFCAENIRFEAKVCRFCNRDLPENN